MTEIIALISCLVFTISPVSAQDAATPYQDAVAARLAGDPAKAVLLLEALVAAHPEALDARVQLGYAYLALNRLQDAERQFRAVVQAAPDYADAQDGLAMIAKRKSATRDNLGWVEVDGAISKLTGTREDWHEVGVNAGIPVGRRNILSLSTTYYERFGLNDTELSALYTARAGENVWLRAGGSTTPSADFRPSAGLTGGLDWRVASGRDATIVGFDTAWRSFPLQTVWSFSPSLTQFLLHGKASFTAKANSAITDNDRLRVGGLLRGDLYPHDGTRLFVGAASGPDTDLGIVSTRSSLFGGFELPVGKGIAVKASIAHDWRNDESDRTEARIGLKVGL